ncbi:MAG TPA: hypothetical protein O0X39_01955 [Methanocorpusculum sp.]|nr:hypothetical protein [Methanocorpusculum sp.]
MVNRNVTQVILSAFAVVLVLLMAGAGAAADDVKTMIATSSNTDEIVNGLALDETTDFVLLILDEDEFKSLQGNVFSRLDSKIKGTVTITIPENRLTHYDIPALTTASIPADTVKACSISKNKGVVVLWAPLILLECEYNDGYVTITGSEDLFRHFDNENALMKVSKSDFIEKIDRLSFSTYEELQNWKSKLLGLDDSVMANSVVGVTYPYTERTRYFPKTSRDILTGLSGRIYKGTTSGITNKDYTAYQETEIYLNGDGDLCEIIYDVNSANNNIPKAWLVIYDKNDWKHGGNGNEFFVVPTEFTGTNYLEYQFLIQDWGYYGALINPVNGRCTNYGQYVDSTKSQYIKAIDPSSELYIKNTNSYVNVECRIEDKLVRTIYGGFAKPINVLRKDVAYNENVKYVSTSSQWNSQGEVETTHKCGTNVK